MGVEWTECTSLTVGNVIMGQMIYAKVRHNQTTIKPVHCTYSYVADVDGVMVGLVGMGWG